MRWQTGDSAQGEKLKAASSAALNILSLGILLGTMLFGVMLCGFFRMVSGMQVVTMRDVGMMPGLFIAPAGVVLGRFFVMAGRMFMVLRRFCMMFCALLAHRVFEV
jgi:hypothetical protein